MLDLIGPAEGYGVFLRVGSVMPTLHCTCKTHLDVITLNEFILLFESVLGGPVWFPAGILTRLTLCGSITAISNGEMMDCDQWPTDQGVKYSDCLFPPYGQKYPPHYAFEI